MLLKALFMYLFILQFFSKQGPPSTPCFRPFLKTSAGRALATLFPERERALHELVCPREILLCARPREANG